MPFPQQELSHGSISQAKGHSMSLSFYFAKELVSLDIPALLAKVPLFAALPHQELIVLSAIVHPKTLAKEQVVFRQGDPGDQFLILVEGAVRVELASEQGKELTLAILRPYQSLGELALLDDVPRSATVVTLEETRYLFIHKRDFNQLVERYPSMCVPMMRQLAKRVRILTDDIASMAFMDSFTRVARKLVALAQDLGELAPDGKILITQALTHQQLANLVGITRETVTKILNDMRNKGLITVNRHRIIIHSPKQFAEWANLPSFAI
jgi:CRP/FNR family cyclic AMP-dependent transcriptional regulator